MTRIAPHLETRLVDSGPAVASAGLVHRVRPAAGPGPHPHRHPAVVMLHGRGGDEDGMWIFAHALPPDWLVVAPRAPMPDSIGGYAWRPRDRDEWPALAEFDAAVAVVSRLLDALPGLYGADPDWIYLMGFSQGAATSYAVALRHPGRIRGIAGLVGFVPGDCGDVAAVEPLAGLPIMMIVGRQDELIPPERSRACARTLAAAGAVLDCREYEVGHKLSIAGIRDLRAWWRAREAARVTTGGG